MSEKLFCLECGKELPEVGAISGYCSKSCYQKAYRNKKKSNSDKAKELVEETPSIVESIKEGLGQAVEMEELDRLRKENEELKDKLGKQPESTELLGMIETKQKAKADEMWSAIRLLHNQKQNLEQLTKQADDGMKLAEKELSDCNHKMFLLNMTDSELLELAKSEREILSRRSGFKNLLTIYGLLERLDFQPEVTQAINYGKIYSLKTEQGKFSFGDIFSEFKTAQSLMIEECAKKSEEKAKEDESLKELKEYIEKLHESPITGRMISTISFAKNSKKDLETKINSLESKAKSFRVNLSNSTITYYN